MAGASERASHVSFDAYCIVVGFGLGLIYGRKFDKSTLFETTPCKKLQKKNRS